MHSFRVANLTTGAGLGEHVEKADSFFSRLRGLLGRSGLQAGGGLWITRCNSVHMFFMRFPIDVVFLDAKLRVIRAIEGLRPWQVTRVHLTADSCLELPVGTITASGTLAGHQLAVEASARAESGTG